ncbi:hypothetical protein, partial [Corynebacterium variabile]|uniref:hypothetical protein n=1 Tax=Corynebacterium variabile TaxID=1727 RepID=UPI0028AC4B29
MVKIVWNHSGREKVVQGLLLQGDIAVVVRVSGQLGDRGCVVLRDGPSGFAEVAEPGVRSELQSGIVERPLGGPSMRRIKNPVVSDVDDVMRVVRPPTTGSFSARATIGKYVLRNDESARGIDT